MLSGWQTTWYFTWRGLGYGFALGALGGTLAYPVLGTFFGGIWGGAVGLTLGVILGLASHVYNRRAYQQQLDFDDYQAALTWGAGVGAAVLSALPLFIIFAPIAAITAAYVAHRYAEDNAQQIAKRKVETLSHPQRHMERKGVINQYINHLFSKTKWLLIIGSLGAAVIAFVAGLPFLPMASLILQAVVFGVVALLGGAAIITMVGMANGIMIQFMNRLFFTQSTDKATYKRALVAFCAIFTLLISPVVTLFVGTPIAALFAAWAAASYADWYYESRPKLKREALLNSNNAAYRQAAGLEQLYDDDFDLIHDEETTHDQRYL